MKIEEHELGTAQGVGTFLRFVLLPHQGSQWSNRRSRRPGLVQNEAIQPVHSPSKW